MIVQPDIAIIDARIELAHGADPAVTLPLYTPQTRPVLLADDDQLAANARVVELDVLPAGSAAETLVSWMAKASCAR